MADYPPIIFGRVPPEKVAQVIIRLAEQGIPLHDDGLGGFSANFRGVEAKANYEAGNQTLIVQIISKPFKWPFFLVRGRIIEAAKEVGLYELVH